MSVPKHWILCLYNKQCQGRSTEYYVFYNKQCQGRSTEYYVFIINNVSAETLNTMSL